MQLRRLSEMFPAICCGEGPAGLDLRAACLRDELNRLGRRPIRFRFESFCPLDFLTLFAPERRNTVLTDGPDHSDWLRAAAVRILEYCFGKPAAPGLRDRRTGMLLRHVLVLEGEGPLRFVREVFAGHGDDAECFLTEPAVWRSFTLCGTPRHGGTSAVFPADRGEGVCILKLPLPGRIARFRRDLRCLRRFRHPNLPALRFWSEDGTPFCVMERFRTGRAACSACNLPGFRDALEYVHGRGMLHGDVRRSNLGLNEAGEPVLFDFSHAKKLTSPAEAECEIRRLTNLLT